MIEPSRRTIRAFFCIYTKMAGLNLFDLCIFQEKIDKFAIESPIMMFDLMSPAGSKSPTSYDNALSIFCNTLKC